VLGSVAGAVVANAPCSVQVARAKRDLEGAAA
jgi:nucleotide-binding universal stress UspA family protein